MTIKASTNPLVQADVLRLLIVSVDVAAPRGWEWTARVHDWDERIPLGRGGSPQEAIEELAERLDESASDDDMIIEAEEITA